MTTHKTPKRTRRGKGETRLSPRRTAAVQKQAKALELRAAGKGYAEIAATLGYADHSGAFRAVQAGLDRAMAEPAEHCRRLELDRLDRLWAAHWKRRAQIAHAKILLAISERRARLLALDKQPPNLPEGPSELLIAIRRRIEAGDFRVAPGPAKELEDGDDDES
ncbi:MAG: hypothetical protein JXR96_04885 [Deltaproteobacteria bacterium]|nr:hypothetical protein [Deltaproteobacteria bacterium]